MPKRKKKSTNQNNKSLKKCKVEEKSVVSNFADFTLPGFHYLGPGGRKQNGPPTNPIDAIAMKHDEAYDKVIDEFKETKDIQLGTQEIKVADEKFIEDVMQTEATTAKEVLGKAIGLAGIGIKATVEKALGFTLYPAFDQIKENNSAECSTSVRAGDDFN